MFKSLASLPLFTVYKNGVILHGAAAALWVPFSWGMRLSGSSNAPSLARTQDIFVGLLVAAVTWPVSYLGTGAGYLAGLIWTPTNNIALLKSHSDYARRRKRPPHHDKDEQCNIHHGGYVDGNREGGYDGNRGVLV